MQRMAEETVSRWHGNLRSDLRRPNRPVAIDPRTHFVKAIVGGDHQRVSSTVRFKPIASPDLPLSRLSTTAFASVNIRLTQLCTTPL